MFSLLIDNIYKSFKDNKVIKGASIKFDQGSIYGLLGRNASGKTTLFDLISKKKDLDGGNIYILDNGEKRKIKEDDIFYMVANPLLPDFLTAREFIKFYFDVNKDRISTDKTIDELFDFLSFDEKERDRLIQTYSLGTKNKLQMLMFLVEKRPIILMDEPLTSLDVVVQLQIKKFLKHLKGDSIIILSTHILQLAEDLADDIVILNDGKLRLLDRDDIKRKDFEEEIISLLSNNKESIEDV